MALPTCSTSVKLSDEAHTLESIVPTPGGIPSFCDSKFHARGDHRSDDRPWHETLSHRNSEFPRVLVLYTSSAS